MDGFMSDVTKDIIRYDVLAQDALRGVVRKVLSEVEKTGSLPGDHHFYITFNTTAPGVRISNAIKERFPDEMTIIIQHQFWNLRVNETRFDVGLSFSDVPEMLSIPFNAVTGFVDPSVKFVLQFDLEPEEYNDDTPEEILLDLAKQNKDATIAEPLPLDEAEAEVSPKKQTSKKASAKSKAKKKTSDTAKKSEAEDGEDNNVVSLDSFRNK
jgi:hypothetical protein